MASHASVGGRDARRPRPAARRRRRGRPPPARGRGRRRGSPPPRRRRRRAPRVRSAATRPGPSSQSAQWTTRASVSSSYAPATTTISPISPLCPQSGEHLVEKECLLRGPEPRGRSGREHDGGHGARFGVSSQVHASYGRLRSHRALREGGYRCVVLRLAVGLLSLSALAFGGPAADAAPSRVFAPAHRRRGPGVVELGRVRADGNERVRHRGLLLERGRLLGAAEGDLHGRAALVLRLLGRARRLLCRRPGARADRHRVELRRTRASRLRGLVRDRPCAVDPDRDEDGARRPDDRGRAGAGNAGDAPADELDAPRAASPAAWSSSSPI